jgi:hypothetical protein
LILLKDCPFISEDAKEEVLKRWNSYFTDG